jgi:hypothetical protein
MFGFRVGDLWDVQMKWAFEILRWIKTKSRTIVACGVNRTCRYHGGGGVVVEFVVVV